MHLINVYLHLSDGFLAFLFHLHLLRSVPFMIYNVLAGLAHLCFVQHNTRFFFFNYYFLVWVVKNFKAIGLVWIGFGE